MLESVAKTAEGQRLANSASPDSAWRKWGPYLAARQWGTVREDYSPDGDAWHHFPFDQAHTRAYRWGEDGIAGLTDRYGFLNLAVALWNTHDDRLKERWFGLTGPEGNHGEDVKEYYWALDATPTHSWAQHLYRYPQAAYPYQQLREVNRAAGHGADEFELADTGILADNRFFDVVTTHAKVDSGDICITYDATNHGPDAAPLHLVPQLWFRNTWAWGRDKRHATMQQVQTDDEHGFVQVVAEHAWLNRQTLSAQGSPRVLWCDNETDEVAAFGAEHNRAPYPKSAVDRAIVHGDDSLLSPDPNGTKVAFDYFFDAVQPGQTITVKLRLTAGDGPSDPFGADFDATLATRRAEADEFYDAVIPAGTSDVDRHVARRAFAGLNWGKQVYRYSVSDWLDGDPAGPVPPPERTQPWARNTGWRHLDLADVISMPDDWEYPWFATWDLAFHCVALAHVDPAFAKQQLLLLCREWAQHPDGQLPAYEWKFSDVNPPVHAWAAWLVYLADGATDTDFLTRVMSKLLLNFGWWVNRKDEAGNELFEGGFLGMDNISLFDRSNQVPDGQRLEQSDATSWIAFACLCLLRIAQELALTQPAWGDVATTFLERFLSITEAVENFGGLNESLWNEADGFFYDILVDQVGHVTPVAVRSLVGFVPLLAVANSPAQLAGRVPELKERRAWLKRNRPQMMRYMLTDAGDGNQGGSMTLSLVDRDRYPRLLSRLFDEAEFLSPYGIRSLSAAYREGMTIQLVGQDMHIRYTPGMSEDGMFGGNSNWRGPVWFPLNVLLADALRHRAQGVGGQVEVEFPTGSGQRVSLLEAADRLEQRLLDLFRPGPDGRRPGQQRDMPSGPLWDEHPTFSEFFHGDSGVGLGASHQTGWTGLVAHLLCRRPETAG